MIGTYARQAASWGLLLFQPISSNLFFQSEISINKDLQIQTLVTVPSGSDRLQRRRVRAVRRRARRRRHHASRIRLLCFNSPRRSMDPIGIEAVPASSGGVQDPDRRSDRCVFLNTVRSNANGTSPGGADLGLQRCSVLFGRRIRFGGAR